MSARRIIAIAATGVLVAGGAGAAVAAVSKGDPKKSEDAVLADAAKRLNVSPGKLRGALKAAQDAQLDKQLDQAVDDGDLTRKQAEAIKQAREQSGTVLGPGGPRHGRLFFPRGHGVAPGAPDLRERFGPGPSNPGQYPHFRRPGPRFGLFADLAKALSISERELFTRLGKGESIAAIAKAEGTSLASVRSSVKAAAKTRADKAVKAGDLTRKQADALLEHLDEHLKNLNRRPRAGLRNHDRVIPRPPNVRPGSFAPAPAPPPELIS